MSLTLYIHPLWVKKHIRNAIKTNLHWSDSVSFIHLFIKLHKVLFFTIISTTDDTISQQVNEMLRVLTSPTIVFSILLLAKLTDVSHA